MAPKNNRTTEKKTDAKSKGEAVTTLTRESGTGKPAPVAAAPAVAAPTVAAPLATAPVSAATAAAVPAKAATAVAPVTAAVAVAAPARDRSAIVALLASVQGADAEAARDAAATLGQLPADSEAVDVLCAVVRNENGYFHAVVRTAAAAALGSLGDRRAVDALIVGVHDTMAEASEEAIKSLGRLGDRRAVQPLEAVVRNESGFFLEHIRAAARQSLTTLTR